MVYTTSALGAFGASVEGGDFHLSLASAGPGGQRPWRRLLGWLSAEGGWGQGGSQSLSFLLGGGSLPASLSPVRAEVQGNDSVVPGLWPPW